MALPVTFTLTSTATHSAAPFAFGHVFAEGDVPAGQFLNSDLVDWQASPTTYWPDGSLRHAIIAGRADTLANVPRNIVLTTASTDRSGTSLTEADLSASLPTTTLACGTETISLNTLVGTAALKRTVCTGPIMSNWLYRQPIAGSNNLVAWFDVRIYKGGNVEVFPWIENGYMFASGLSNDSRQYIFTMGGTQRFNATVDIKARTRIPLVGTVFSHWTTDPQVTPKHDCAYFMASKMTSNYGWLSPSASTLNGLIQTYTPNTLAGISSAMGAAGSSAALLHISQALYITSNGDSRAWKAAIVFGLSGGSWSTHYRDENTNEPLNYTDWPNASLQGGTPGIPGITGGVNGNAVTTHQPSYGYLPWLLTGRWWFLEEQLYWAIYNYLSATVNQRRGENFGQNLSLYPPFSPTAAAGIADGRNGSYTPRGAAWTLRGIAQSLAIIPTSHPCYASFKNCWEQNVSFYHDTFVTGTYEQGDGDYWLNSFGVMTEYGNPYGNTDYWGLSGWMHGMMQQVWGFCKELNLTQTTNTKLNAVVNHNLKLSVGLAGGVPGWNYRRFIVYSLVLGDADNLPNPWYSSFAEALTAHETFHGSPSIPNTPGLSLMAHSSNTPFAVGSSSWPYFGQQFAALAYAVTHGISGAEAGYTNVTTASNFNTVAAQFNDDPSYGIVPREAVAGSSPVTINGTVGNASAAGSTSTVTNESTGGAVNTSYTAGSGVIMYAGKFAPVSDIETIVGNAVAAGLMAFVGGSSRVNAIVGAATATGKTAVINGELPAWVPVEGTFANISTNTMASIRPTGWSGSDVAGPFSNWSGGAYAKDFSTLGAYVVHGSGHLASPDAALYAGVWCFDLDTLAWVGRNVPAAPLLDNPAHYNSFQESNQSATLGHPITPHTYDGLVYRPGSSSGASSQGNLLRICVGGVSNVCHEFDLSSTTAVPTRIFDNLGGNSYPQAAADPSRNGFWYLAGNGNGPLRFINFTTLAVTTYPGVEFNEYGDYTLTYIPAPLECLVATGRSGSGGVNMGVYVAPFSGGVPQAFVKVSTSGTKVGDSRAGTCWSTLLNCLVSYEAGGSYTVHKLRPPVGSLTTGIWAWESETLTGVGGAVPCRTGSADNGAWGRFLEVSAARCFIWCDSINGPVQAWRLTGM